MAFEWIALLLAVDVFKIVLVQSKSCQPEFRQCKTEYSSGIYGYRCHSSGTENGKLEMERKTGICIPEGSWCSLKQPKLRCPTGMPANQILKNCLHTIFDVTQGQHCNPPSGLGKPINNDYILIEARVPWYLAEEYCSKIHSEFHLVSFDSEAEATAVASKLEELYSRARMLEFEGARDPFLQHDPLARSSKCYDCEEGIDCKERKFDFWLGIFFNFATDRWENTDGSEIISTIPKIKPPRLIGGPRVKDNGCYANIPPGPETETLVGNFKEIQQSCGGNCETGHRRIKFVYNGEYKLGTAGAFDLPYSDDSTANVLCKRRVLDKNKISQKKVLDNLPELCLTGFKCPNEQKCLFGAHSLGETGSDLCNGIKDCEDGSDELLSNCHHKNFSSYRQSNNGLQYVYVAIPHTYATAKTYCQNNGWYLPSLHNREDYGWIGNFPRKFMSELEGKISNVIIRWRNYASRWTIYLGRRLSSTQWDDGSTIDYGVMHFYKPVGISENNTLIVIHKGVLTGIPDNEPDFNPFVCQVGATSLAVRNSLLLFVTFLTVLPALLYFW